MKVLDFIKKHAAGLLLFVIYAAFISLGLPDALLGSAWPVMRLDFNVPLGTAGIISMIVAGGTIISAMNSGRLITTLGTGKLTLISCLLTAGALFGISKTSVFVGMIFMAIPLGLGAGAIDSALNNFVAGHYKVHHMNWLHAFWGIGATTGPLIMLRFLSADASWNKGYLTVACIQFSIATLLLVSIRLWKRVEDMDEAHHLNHEADRDTDDLDHEDKKSSEPKSTTANSSDKKNADKKNADKNDTSVSKKRDGREKSVLKIPGVKYTLAAFFFYCAAEITVGLWGASYLVETKGMLSKTAAGWVALYYGGITTGRIINGFISMRVKNRILIIGGQMLSLTGALLLILPLQIIASQLGLLLLGLGFAPVFPGLIHETPIRFGKQNSAKLIGLQMASAYTGTTFMPPVFGAIASFIGMQMFPFAVILFIVAMTFMSERILILVSRTEKGV